LEGLKRFDEALECYERAIAINPRSAWAWNNKGWNLASQGRNDEAIKCYDRAIEIIPSEVLPWINKCESLKALNRIDDAINCIEAAIPVVTEKRSVLMYAGSLCTDYKFDYAKGLEYYQKVLKMTPEDELIKAGIAEILINLRRYGEGRTYALDAARTIKDPNLQCIVQFLVLVSDALESGHPIKGLPKMVEYCRASEEKSVADALAWRFGGLINTIRGSTVAFETKFLLLALIDLQTGKLKISDLSFFNYAGSGVV
jgi:tetratricopeptide (TPR) repeat protein